MITATETLPVLSLHLLGCQPYADTLAHMQAVTNQRTPDSSDQLWACTHPPVFTQGQAGRAEHVGQLGDIPLIHTDRGGQVTYHGPGQLIIYCLMDLNRRHLGVRALVQALEQATLQLLAQHDIAASLREGAPGVYVQGRKIASLGLKVRRGCSYHGLSLNVDMDLSPFTRITPCGLSGMQVTQWVEHAPAPGLAALAYDWGQQLARILGYTLRIDDHQERPWHCQTSP